MRISQRTAFVVGLVLTCVPVAAAAECDALDPGYFADAGPEAMSVCPGDDQLMARDGVGRTPLHMAVMHSPDPAVTHALLKMGASVEVRDARLWTPLHALAAEGNVPGHVSALVNWGAEIDAGVSDDECLFGRCETTPLHLAVARRGVADLVRALLAAGADPLAVDADGQHALHIAAEVAEPEVIMSLIASGAKINEEDGDGFTPLHRALRGPATSDPQPPELASVAMLIDLGADLTAASDEGITPLMLAAAYAQDAELWALVYTATDQETACAEDDKGRTAKKLFDANPNLERDATYWDLHQACP